MSKRTRWRKQNAFVRSQTNSDLKTSIEWEMNWKGGKWLTPKRQLQWNIFFISLLKLMFRDWGLEFNFKLNIFAFPFTRKSFHQRFNWLQFGAIFECRVHRVKSRLTRRFTHSGSGNLSAEVYSLQLFSERWFCVPRITISSNLTWQIMIRWSKRLCTPGSRCIRDWALNSSRETTFETFSLDNKSDCTKMFFYERWKSHRRRLEISRSLCVAVGFRNPIYCGIINLNREEKKKYCLT